MNLKQNQQGFTIVELLIVIVVIAILAAISIVAYSGIQSRARTSAGQSTAGSVVKKIEAIGTVKGSYYGSAAAVSGSDINTYANAAPAAAEGVLDNTASVIAAGGVATHGLTATTANNGNTVSVYICQGGANVWYWNYTTSAAVQMKAGAGCS